MSIEALQYIAGELKATGINYQFMEWRGDVIYPYFTGEYTESAPYTEDGLIGTEFMLNGFHRGEWLALEEAKEKIERRFANSVHILPSGAGIAVNYAGALVIPQSEAGLARIQINLTIQEWKVN